jgi:hypothetical protein
MSFEIYFIIILPSAPRSSVWSLFYGILYKTLFSHTFPMPRHSHHLINLMLFGEKNKSSDFSQKNSVTAPTAFTTRDISVKWMQMKYVLGPNDKEGTISNSSHGLIITVTFQDFSHSQQVNLWCNAFKWVKITSLSVHSPYITPLLCNSKIQNLYIL